MARIPDEQIERLKTDVSLVRLVEAFGVELKRHGKDWLGRCPFHDDRTPSLVVSPESNLWHCLGACQVGGSVIDWVMRTQGLSFRHAVELLKAEQFPALAAAEGKPVKASTVRRLETPLTTDADDRAALARVIDFYHDSLKQNPEALDYLAKRGLAHAELIDTFKLGLANRTLAYRLPEKNRAAGAAIREQLQRVGILRASGHEHFNGSLVVPVLGEHGEVLEVYGRKLRDDLRPGTPKHLYLPGPHAGVWNWAALQASPEIILCEALIDAMTFWCAGFRNVTASYGVEGFTPDHLAAFQRYGTRRVLIAYDRDEAGDKAALRLAEQLTAEGIECFRVLFPKGMDANEYALRVQPATKSLGLALRRAEWLGKGQAPERQIDIDELMDAQVLAEPVAELRVNGPAPRANGPALEEMGPALAALPELPAAPPPAEEPAQALPASPLPEPPMNPVPAYVLAGDEMRLTLHGRFYRVRGLPTKPTPDQLKVNLLAKPHGEASHPAHGGYHVDTVDLYSARQRQVFAKQASVELGAAEDSIKKDLGLLILALEGWQEEQRAQQAAANDQQKANLSDPEKAQALNLLKDPALLERILADFARAGVVGEESNKLVGYLACVSRKLAKPLAVIIQSSSAAGKTSLQDAILALMPKDECVRYSAMTGQALYYLGQANLKHKILAIAEEEGAERASYALKLLQSDGELTIASTGKDATTGQLVTQEYRVEGPVMLFLTTTAIDIDEELLNRCLVLSVNESREQTAAIHAAQRTKRTLAGLVAGVEKDAVLSLHRNAQRLLRPLAVVNPYADQLTFLDHKTRTRRDHEKYLTLIDSIALLHQYQRPLKSVRHPGQAVDYIEVQPSDIAAANRLAHAVLGHCLDELPPQTRRLLSVLVDWVNARCAERNQVRAEHRFSRKEVREHCGWGETQLRVHMERLVSMEYLLVHRGGRGQSFVYELVYDGPSEGPAYLPGLIDSEALAAMETTPTTLSSRGADGRFAGSLRPQRGPVAGGSRDDEIEENPEEIRLESHLTALDAENARLGDSKINGRSYPQPVVAEAAPALAALDA